MMNVPLAWGFPVCKGNGLNDNKPNGPLPPPGLGSYVLKLKKEREKEKRKHETGLQF